jgi:hypothetical protein
MPHHRPIGALAKQQPERPLRSDLNSWQRYKEVESRRAELQRRLQSLGKGAQRHPAYKNVVKLLNDHYFKQKKLAQRLAALHAASWLISVLERLPLSI